VLWKGVLGSGDNIIADRRQGNADTLTLFDEFVDALVLAGLYRDEAKAMLETWHRSYFHTRGVKVFWILPDEMTNNILPIKINPVPVELNRVMVGRSEILTPEFEAMLISTQYPKLDGSDRFYNAYIGRFNELKKNPEDVIKLEAINFEIKAYPNPAQSTLNISVTVPQEDIGGLETGLYDMKGSCVVKIDFEEKDNGSYLHSTVNIAYLSPGAYVLVCRHGKAVEHQKIVISK
jgi:hypothetical protein